MEDVLHFAGPIGRAVCPRPLACCGCGFESSRQHVYLSVASAVLAGRDLCKDTMPRSEKSRGCVCVCVFRVCVYGVCVCVRAWAVIKCGEGVTITLYSMVSK
jgi:hypothetical protein